MASFENFNNWYGIEIENKAKRAKYTINPYFNDANSTTTGATTYTTITGNNGYWIDNGTTTTDYIYINPGTTISNPTTYLKIISPDDKLKKLKEFLVQSIEEAEKQTKTTDEEQRTWNLGFAEALQEVMTKIEELENPDENNPPEK